MKKIFGVLFVFLLMGTFFHSNSERTLAQASDPIPANFFVHTATADNSVDHITTLDHPLLNGNPDAVLIVTQNFNPSGLGNVYNDRAIGVYYFNGLWHLYNENQEVLPNNASFNVYIAGDADVSFTHVHDADNKGLNETFLDHPQLNNRPDQVPFSTHYWTPHQVYNLETTYAGYQQDVNRWAIFKEQTDEFNFLPENAAFHVVLPSPQHETFVHEATSSNITSNWTEVDHPLLNENPDAIFFAETRWDDGLTNYGKNTRSNLGVWYSQSTQKWNVFTQDLSDINEESKFNILIPKSLSPNETFLTLSPEYDLDFTILRGGDPVDTGTNPENPQLYVGIEEFFEKIALLQFDLGAIPADATITSAKLKIWHEEAIPSNAAPRQICVHQVNEVWNEATANLDMPEIGTECVAPQTVGSTEKLENFSDLTPLIQSWVNGSVPDHGLALKVSEDVFGYIGFDSLEGVLQPELTIGYRVQNSAEISLSASNAMAGTNITITGSGFIPGGYTGQIFWDGVSQAEFEIPAGGAFSTEFQIPEDATAGEHTITVCSLSPCATGEFEQTGSATITVSPSSTPSDFVIFLPLIVKDN